ncbi:hypothetical protein M0802_013159, partial [Mischocyttarus mexicanus]
HRSRRSHQHTQTLLVNVYGVARQRRRRWFGRVDQMTHLHPGTEEKSIKDLKR